MRYKQPFPGFRVGQDRSERLIQLMYERCGELAHCRHAPYVGQRFALPLLFRVGFTQRADVAAGADVADKLARQRKTRRSCA